MKLVEDWKKAYKWFSVQAMGIAVILLGAWGAMPDDLKSSLPDWTPRAMAVAILALGIGGRLVQQGQKDETQ